MWHFYYRKTYERDKHSNDQESCFTLQALGFKHPSRWTRVTLAVQPAPCLAPRVSQQLVMLHATQALPVLVSFRVVFFTSQTQTTCATVFSWSRLLTVRFPAWIYFNLSPSQQFTHLLPSPLNPISTPSWPLTPWVAPLLIPRPTAGNCGWPYHESKRTSFNVDIGSVIS